MSLRNGKQRMEATIPRKKRQYKRKEKQMNHQSINELQLLVLEESLKEFEITVFHLKKRSSLRSLFLFFFFSFRDTLARRDVSKDNLFNKIQSIY